MKKKIKSQLSVIGNFLHKEEIKNKHYNPQKQSIDYTPKTEINQESYNPKVYHGFGEWGKEPLEFP
ncbi:MAG: hypothetical protein ACP5OG_00755 [Candidatus Nanoarchaeia archaeon]